MLWIRTAIAVRHSSWLADMQEAGGLKRPEKVKFGGKFHVHIKIQDALCWDDKMLSGSLNDGERTLSAQEAREALFACQAKGHTYFCGCDNPGYDGRCAGHE